MKKKIMLIFMCLLIILIIFIKNSSGDNDTEDIIEENIISITKALVVKELSLIEYSKTECINMPKVITS